MNAESIFHVGDKVRFKGHTTVYHVIAITPNGTLYTQDSSGWFRRFNPSDLRDLELTTERQTIRSDELGMMNYER